VQAAYGVRGAPEDAGIVEVGVLEAFGEESLTTD
jgi:hypothetical protein